ncbi:MAG: type II toxin-antitoxin system antitoxin SocA domain-containing protein [Salinispira sp.]
MKLTNLAKAIAYICYKFRDDPFKLGSLKMNKILWFSDVTARALLGKTISEYNTYLAQELGPVLPPVIPAIDSLSRRGLVSAQDFDLYDHRQRVFTLVDVKEFEEIEKTMDKKYKMILDEWIDYARGISAMRIALVSHTYSWWKRIAIGRPIQVQKAVKDKNPPKIQTEIIHTLEQKFGLN